MVAGTECGMWEIQREHPFIIRPLVFLDQQLLYPPLPSLEHSVPPPPTSCQTIGCLAFSLFVILIRNLVSRSTLKPWRPQPTLESLSRAGLGSEGLWASGMLFRDAYRREDKRPVSPRDENAHGGGESVEEHKGLWDSYYRPGNGIPTLGPGWPSVCLLSCGGRSVLYRDWPA